MATSTIPAATAWLVDLFTASTDLGAADPPVDIRDGMVVGDDAATSILWVGVDDPDAPDAPVAAEGALTWAGLGAQRMNEVFGIPCTIRATDGSTSVATIRAVTFAAYDAAVAIVRANANLGGTTLEVLGISGFRFRPVNVSRGVVGEITFRIDCKSRI